MAALKSLPVHQFNALFSSPQGLLAIILYFPISKQELDGTRAYLEIGTGEMSVVNAHLNDLPVKFSDCVNEGQDKLPTMYWLASQKTIQS